jgi:hypothetical protein
VCSSEKERCTRTNVCTRYLIQLLQTGIIRPRCLPLLVQMRRIRSLVNLEVCVLFSFDVLVMRGDCITHCLRSHAQTRSGQWRLFVIVLPMCTLFRLKRSSEIFYYVARCRRACHAVHTLSFRADINEIRSVLASTMSGFCPVSFFRFRSARWSPWKHHRAVLLAIRIH